MTNKNNKLRPGAGWTYAGGAVWDHANGTRVHVGGLMVRLPTGLLIRTPTASMRKAIRVNGGNRKRVIMAYAVTLSAEAKQPNEGASK